jgi:sulfur relay (sulfurtransferase) DsrC/TusE family protein
LGKQVKIFYTAFLIVFFSLAIPLAGLEKIPLLISEHHADHMEFFYRYGGKIPAAMVVLDAHADTIENENSELIQQLFSVGSFKQASMLVGNHNWIHPLASDPLVALVWINVINGLPRSNTAEGFIRTTSAWKSDMQIVSSTVEELRFLDITGEMLFISIDLDFFYNKDYGLEDVPVVLDSLFSFSSRWHGPVVWAICLSRPWLPDDFYAWTLLEKSLYWLTSRPEFNVPELTLFGSKRVDTSRTVQAILAEGREVPMLREADAPERVKILIRELQRRK